MSKPSLRQLRTFLAVLESGTVPEAAGNTRAIIDAWIRRTGLAARPAMALGSGAAIKALVASGLGASIPPERAPREVPAGAIARPPRPRLSRALGYVLRREAVMARGLRAFVAAPGAT